MMNRRWIVLRRHLTRTDALLLIAGALGLLVFFTNLPAQHPDSAYDYSLPKAEVAKKARAWVESNGFEIPEGATQRVYQHFDDALLGGLQAEVGRPETVRLLHSPARERLPAYHWHVSWQKNVEEEEDYQMGVLLTLDGKGYNLDGDVSEEEISQEQVINRKALAYALDSLAGESEQASVLAGVPDSTLEKLLFFGLALPDTVSADTAQTAALVQAAFQAGEPVRLDRRAAARLARYHLRRTALRDYTFRVDTVWDTRQAGVETATVRLWGSAFHGQRPRVEAEMTPTGALLRLDTRFEHNEIPAKLADDSPTSFFYEPPERRTSEAETAPVTPDSEDEAVDEEDSVTIAPMEADTLAGIITGVLYVLLVAASALLFFRRMGARVVDMKSALRDALWGGFFVGGLVAALVPVAIFRDVGSFWAAVLIVSVIVLFAAAGGAFLIFLASGAMDSVARAEWSEKLTTLSLMRHGALRNMPMGAALVRGLAAAGVLLGLTTLLLVLFPDAVIDFDAMDSTPNDPAAFSLFGFVFGVSAWAAQFIGLTVLLGVGTLLYRWRRSAWLVVPGLTLVLVLLQTTLAELEPLGYATLSAGVVSLVLAWTFWRYDFIAAFFALVLANVLWSTATGWLTEGSPFLLDALLAFASAGIVGVTGLVGLLSARSSTEVPSYVPSYIRELAEEERLQRELEIAQEVQQSFLPRHMPEVEGLDIAAMCLAAQEVGGDYYDFIEVAPRKLAVAIGDVSGKGIQAAFFMTLAKGFLQTLAREGLSPAEVMRRLNTLFCANAPRGTFVSMIYGVVDVEEEVFTFARAGHNPLIYKRSPETEPEFIRPKGMAIGLANGARFDEQIAEERVALRPGDTLVFYTDGFSEAMNTAGEQFGDERLARKLDAVCRRPANEILRAISGEVYLHVEAAGRHDDMTMIVVKRDGRVLRSDVRAEVGASKQPEKH